MSRPYSKTIALITGTGSGEGIDRDLLADARVHNNVAVTIGAECGRVLYYLEGFYEGLRVLVLPRHGPALYPPDRSPAALVKEKGHESHIWLLHQLGVSAVYAFSTVGAIDLDVPLADKLCFVVPHEYGRGLGATIHSFAGLAKTVHPGMREPFSPHLRAHARAAIQAVGGTALMQGLYIYSGPDQFETAAEIQATRRLYDGWSHRLVGMTAGPELALCRQMGIPYAVICAASNYAEGLASATPVTHQAVLDTMKTTAEKTRQIAWEIVQIAAAELDSSGQYV
jgi:5'-methylthioadenosine phosphorylase